MPSKIHYAFVCVYEYMCMFLYVRVHIYVYRCGGQTSGVISELVSTFCFFKDRQMTLVLLPLPADVCAITLDSTLLEIRLHKHFTNGAELLAPGFYLFGFFGMCTCALIHVHIWMCACRCACMCGG